MAGAFQTTRDIFEHPIWQNIVEFRLFFLLYGKAAFVDGVRVGDVILERGQWVRSIRNLQSDLEYVENRAIKKYSLSTIHRAIESLVRESRILSKPCELGTLFEVVNYAKYQDLGNYKFDNENAERTQREQRQNNNKNTNKTNNTLKDYSSEIIRMAETLKSLILQNNPGAKTPDDLSKWQSEFDKMKRIDKRTDEQIFAVMEFSQRDTFWKANILSAGKLREKFDTLLLQKDRPKQGQQSKVPQKGNFDQRKYTDEYFDSLFKV